MPDSRVPPPSARARKRRWRAPTPRPVRPADAREDRRQHPKRGVEQRVAGVKIAADHIRQYAVRTVAEHRQLPPRWHRRIVRIGSKAGVLYAAHAVLVAVRKHDDVATPRPVLITVINGNPAGAAGDDVEQDERGRMLAEGSSLSPARSATHTPMARDTRPGGILLLPAAAAQAPTGAPLTTGPGHVRSRDQMRRCPGHGQVPGPP